MVEIPITYLSSGEIDTIRTSPTNISLANALLEPAVVVLRLKAAQIGVDFDFWEFVNWIFVGFYWTMLANVGQLNPINYAPLPISPLPRLNTVNFTALTVYDYKYNWFVNETLFDKYSTYLTGTLLPLLGYPSPQIAKLSETNRLHPVMTTFLRSYICEIREWKDLLGAIFAVITTVYVFTTGPFAVVVFVAAWLKCRNNDEGFSSPSTIDVQGIIAKAVNITTNKIRQHSPMVSL